MNPVSITYNSSKQQWQYTPTDQNPQSFPKGKAGKQAAIDAKIKSEKLPVYNMLCHLRRNTGDDQIIRRATDGAIFVCDSMILKPAVSDSVNILARVATPSSSVEYLIFFGGNSGLYSCSCPDHSKGRERQSMNIDNPNRPAFGAPSLRNGIGPMCKHTFGYHFANSTKEELSYTNPFSDQLASDLHWWLRDRTDRFIGQVIDEALVHSEPKGFSRGEFNIEIEDNYFLKMTQQHKAELARVILERTNHSVSLIFS